MSGKKGFFIFTVRDARVQSSPQRGHPCTVLTSERTPVYSPHLREDARIQSTPQRGRPCTVPTSERTPMYSPQLREDAHVQSPAQRGCPCTVLTSERTPLYSPHLREDARVQSSPQRGRPCTVLTSERDRLQAVPLRVGLCISMSAWLLLGDLLICILWQELSHWPSLFSRENPSTGQTHAGLIRGPPAINQREQCILGAGGNSHLKMVEVLRPLVAEWAWVVKLSLGMAVVAVVGYDEASRPSQKREAASKCH